MRVLVLSVMLLTMCVQQMDAQVLDRQVRTEPRIWISGAVGLFDLGALDDGESDARWIFSNAAQFRGTLEYALGGGNTLGMSAGYARVPLRYVPFTAAAFDATGTVTALAITFHGGAGAGLHQIFEASVGALRFSDFTSDVNGARLAPVEGDFDVTFTIGGGFGYTVGDRTQIMLVQDFGIVLHQGTGLPNDASTSAYHRTTRIGVRYGLGTRAR